MELCGVKVIGTGMVKGVSCLKKKNHSGSHTPDLTGISFGYLTVISFGGYVDQRATWLAKHIITGRTRKFLASNLLAGQTGNTSASGGGSGLFGRGKQPSEYKTVVSHSYAIFNPKSRQYKHYKGMPFYEKWNPKNGGTFVEGAKWIIENLGSRPGRGWSLDIIEHSKGFVPGNLRWVPPGSSIQSKNQVHRKLFDVSNKVFAVEAKRRGYKKA